MPNVLIQKAIRDHNHTKQEAKQKWERAKKEAEKQNQKDNYAYISQIYLNMIGETKE